jgi:hypothetical protein
MLFARQRCFQFVVWISVLAALGAALTSVVVDGNTCWSDIWRLPDHCRELEKAQRQAAQLDVERAATLEHLLLTQQLAGEVAEGRRGLREAAHTLRAASASQPAYLDHVRRIYPGSSDEESLCQLILHFVRAALEDQPVECAAVMRSLEIELAASPTDTLSGGRR